MTGGRVLLSMGSLHVVTCPDEQAAPRGQRIHILTLVEPPGVPEGRHGRLFIAWREKDRVIRELLNLQEHCWLSRAEVIQQYMTLGVTKSYNLSN
uniref:Uncharacterized protein n=1 Tax=Engystomops pustulosus TaxID=76066 RepID=A0AAV6YZ35_ENGPU|nr:hypothetical protein GDO81_027591 [Engystomops pustulosus]